MVSADMEDSIVLLSTEKGAYFDLKETGGHIWRLIEEPKTVSQVCDGLMELFDVDRATCEASTLSYVQGMAQNKLIEKAD